jgi:hypothetical protein
MYEQSSAPSATSAVKLLFCPAVKLLFCPAVKLLFCPAVKSLFCLYRLAVLPLTTLI